MRRQNYAGFSLAKSQLYLRRAIGILGIFLPFILVLINMIFQGYGINSSISAYYYTPMRNWFVGSMFAIGICLFTYRGYERKDNIAGVFAGIFAACIALFPTAPETGFSPSDETIGMVHGVCAGVFFITLAIVSIFLFTKTHPNKKPPKRKLIRNRIYTGLGILMLVCVVFMILMNVVPSIKAMAHQFQQTVLVLEFVAVESFGFSWLIKGETLWADVEDRLDAATPNKK